MKEKVKFIENTISEDAARAELESWFDYRKVRQHDRKKPNAITGLDLAYDSLVNGIMYGVISFNSETGELTQKLDFPLTNESGATYLEELKFKPRLTRLEILNAGKGLKPTDFEGKQASYLAAATGKGIGVLNKMDESDRGLSDVIAGYFLQ